MEHNDIQLDKHLLQLDEDSVRDNTIELLVEKLMQASEESSKDVLDNTFFHISHSDIQAVIDGCEKFNEAFEEIATALIDISNKRVF